MANISRRLCRSLLSSSKISKFSKPFCTGNLSSREEEHDSDESTHNSDTDSISTQSPSSTSSPPPPESSPQREVYQRPLENGLDLGVYKAILVGQVGQSPLQKKLRSGKSVTMFSLGTGGIRNNRRPMQNEEPREYANRCAVQWHRVSVYPERLGSIVMKHLLPGSIMYLEGNLETKVFTDPITGLVRRIREVAIRQDGRIVFLAKGGDEKEASSKELKGLGYY
ncbi:single-stranded DNA-binding protein, mitochondrial [Ricinus communis]|uniref:Single-stranded DNA-binding protein, mitochondrial, putative n=1 Tax=Ricinus communis TaxID=3988 RepID=B9RE51_RICCO|nr:single-stranded DNA-binding protein, mitochondrial [Ricinus communis]XP_015584591.1 single-stranded DNA-binding protein, mitochondrial [Ricinus communis]EEF50659.1 Single-stranded DNA-binding protein, mitochondrial precursor, putative [Ricinus communis]|eukprot:XP_002511990.1 single-stranded DNA-binding protein, mitochondrial [Ricinus communis]